MNQEDSEFERRRKENIQKNQEEIKKLFPDTIKLNMVQNNIDFKTPSKSKRYDNTFPKQILPPRSSLKRNCRSKWKRDREDDDTFEDEVLSGENLQENSPVIKFSSWGKKFKNLSVSSDSSDIDYTINYSPKRKKALYRPLDAVTEEDLILVADRVCDKQYDQVDGTSCHQCRQKTLDLKTVCRGKNCVGIRGQFCGPCLKNRYGESAKEAIMDPDWICPPCRGICNCSFCMKKRGKRATGILIHRAKQNGYDNVNSYLGLS